MKRPTARTLAAPVALTLAPALPSPWPSPAQTPPEGFPRVLAALRASPGCLGVDTGQTASGRQVIFAWFDTKQSLVNWYHSDVHQRAMKTVFPGQTFDRQPLPDLPDNSGPILTIVSVSFKDSPKADSITRSIASIGIELYGPLPGGVAVRGRLPPAATKVPRLREIDPTTAHAAAP